MIGAPRRCVAFLLALLWLCPLFAAGQETDPPEAVGSVTLLSGSTATEEQQLDVGLVVFDPGIPADASTYSRLGIFPEIRKAEARYIPVLLRQVLQESNAWGVVRVFPEAAAGVELLVTGRILASDGQRLSLAMTAQDSTGRVWLQRSYLDETADADYPVQPGSDPYADLYRRVANDLLAVRQSLDDRELRAIREVALLRYAANLAPEAFDGYLEQGVDGRFRLLRLPAADDPMLERVETIRNQEHLFIDTVDEQYVDLYEQMAETYNLWRQFGREQAIYSRQYQQRALDSDRRGQRGSFVALEQVYTNYKGVKIQQQELDELATGFNNEVTPTVMEVSGRVFRLNGSLDGQYREWRDILRRIFALESGFPATAPGD